MADTIPISLNPLQEMEDARAYISEAVNALDEAVSALRGTPGERLIPRLAAAVGRLEATANALGME